jgi:transcriptional regulator with XRE-family HTH domain
MNTLKIAGGWSLMSGKRTRFADRRRTIGLNQDQLAELLKVDRSTIVRWERGETTPQPWKRQPLANALKVSLEELDELLAESDADPLAADTAPPEYASAGGVFEMASIGNNGNDALGRADTAPAQASRPVEPWPGAAPADAERSLAGTATSTYGSAAFAAQNLWEAEYDSYEDLMIRRTFLLNAAALAGMSAADKPAAMEAIRHGLNRSLATERAEADASEWQQIALDYGESYPVAAPADLLGPLMTDMLGLQAALRRYASRPAAQRDLLSTAALLSAFTAQTISNMGQPLEARRWWRTARNAADRSGDPYSIIWVRGRESCHAMGKRPIQAVLRLVAEAEALPVEAPPAARLELLGVKAQALALGGQQQESAEALGELRAGFSESPSGYSTSILSWGHERLLHTESFTYSCLGKLTEAERATRDGVALYAANDSSNVRHPAELQLNLAFALVRNGDVREGLHHAQTVIGGLPEAHRGPAVNDGRKLAGIVPAAEQHRTAVQQYQEWVNSFDQPTTSA